MNGWRNIYIMISKFYKKKNANITQKLLQFIKINVKKLKAHHSWNGNWIRQNDVIYIFEYYPTGQEQQPLSKIHHQEPMMWKCILRTFSSKVAVAARTGTSTNILRMCSTSLYAGLKSSPLKLLGQVFIKKYRVLTTSSIWIAIYVQ